MFEEIKESLIQEPRHIVNLLELYDFCKIKVSEKEIRCAFSEDGNPTSICIRLVDNEKLYVTDFARNINKDIFGYIVETRDVEFKSVLNSVKKELGIDSFSNFAQRKLVFGGLFDSIGKSCDNDIVESISEDKLEEYIYLPCERFLNDGISAETQKKFKIGFSIADQRITIPIRNEFGELIGVKGRCNYTPGEFEPKYLYIEQCPMSKTLYGYSENYANLYQNDVYVFESEKSVMQMDTFGYHNAVAIGSHSLSQKQAQMIVSLEPKNVFFMLDNSLDISNTIKNINILRDWMVINSFKIHYFDWDSCDLLGEKDSPTDKGKEIFDKIITNNIKEYIN